MRKVVFLRILGLMLIIFSLALVPPILISVWYQDAEVGHFFAAFLASLLAGTTLWWPLRNTEYGLRRRDGFVTVTLFWVVLGLIGSLPFMLGGPHLGYSQAVFEAVSALTTTGSTVIVGLDALPPSILFYRSELQLLGGIGIVVFAVAILPMLGIGGMQLYRAETPGPMKDDKLTPRIIDTARILWLVYAGLVIACAVVYHLVGMSWFDAVNHSFTTLSTGGMSTHDASLAFFNSPAVEIVAEVFMLLGAINFAVHYAAMTRNDYGSYWRNVEVRTFLVVVATLIAVIATVLWLNNTYGSLLEALRYAALQVISVITSTGYTTTDFSVWPLFLPALLIFSSFMGGCAGSTSGGMKVIRFIILMKNGHRMIERLVHPRIERPLKLEGRVLSERLAGAVWAFFAAYVAVSVVAILLLMADGMDQVSAFGAVAACLNNLGPGLGTVASNFTTVSDLSLWLLSATMILGRLEVFTVLVILSPAYWRQ